MKNSNKKTYLDLCVCCGSIIPEGRMVCSYCENKEKYIQKDDKKSKKGASHKK